MHSFLRPLRPLLIKTVVPLARTFGFARPGNVYQMAACHLSAAERRADIVDGGAFDGTHSLFLAEIFPRARIFAFEPAPASFALLQRMIQKYPRITAVGMALAAETGTAALNINAFPATNSLLPVSASPDTQRIMGGQAECVSSVIAPTITLDEFARRQGHFHCSLLKLDLQGSELPALRGAQTLLREQIRVIIAEVRFRLVYEGEVLFPALDAFVAQFGFRLHYIQNITHHPEDGTMIEADALWVRTR